MKDAHNRSVAEYLYDAWGVCKVVSDSTEEKIADINPFRYRSYYYDAEIKMYYLQSRYYDPNVGRFINADEAEYIADNDLILGLNVFAYCKNSCINTSDPTGHGPFLAIGLQFAINIGRLLIGLEALWSTSDWKFYLFAFAGGLKSINIYSLTQTENALIEDIMYLRRRVKKFSISSLPCFKKMGISVSFIAVLGNKKVSFPVNYCGWFTGLSLTFWQYVASGAISVDKNKKIGSFGIGVSTSSANVGFSQTFYIQLTGNNAFKNNWDVLKKDIMDRLEVLKLFACFF